MAIGFVFSSSINRSYEMLGCESLPLSLVCSIKDEALRFCHVACEEEVLRDRVRSIVNRCLRCRHTSIKVHWLHLISIVIILLMDD